MASQVSDSEFKLDTTNFADVYQAARTLAKTMTQYKEEIDEKKDSLMDTWTGKGRDAFEKKYNLISRQFVDLSDEMNEIAESIGAASDTYRQADTDLAKSLDGKSARN